VIAAVDLDELTDTCTPVARLMDLGSALFAGLPQTSRHHQNPDRLLGQRKPVTLTKLLARKRWPEVGVSVPDQCGCALSTAWRQLTVAGLASLARDQAIGTILLVPLDQPLELPPAQAQPLRGLAHAGHPVDHGLDGLEAIEFAHGHGDCCRRCDHRCTSEPEAGPEEQCDISIRSKRDITNQPLHMSEHTIFVMLN